jgi:hypothetical protein
METPLSSPHYATINTTSIAAATWSLTRQTSFLLAIAHNLEVLQHFRNK